MVAGADGDSITVVTPEPLLELAPTFSPNGVELLIEAYVDGEHALFIANADGRAMRRLDVGMDATWASYRPPDGRQVLFLGTEGPTGSTGIFVVDVASGNVQTVIEPDPSREFAYPAFSPDGSMITYTVESGPEVHVAMADGSGDRVLDLDPDSTFSAGTWSNEGTRIFACAFAKTGRDTDYVAVVAEVNTPGRLVHLQRPANATWACAARWAPDDTAILAIPGSATNQILPPMLWDPLTGAARPVPRDADGTWQRVAP
jgi:Tol biopolymer transport system component